MSKAYGIGFALLIAWASLPGCDDPPVPKPRGYHRIEFPAFEYAAYAHPCGVSFEVPVYSKIERIEGGAPENWHLLVQLRISEVFSQTPLHLDAGGRRGAIFLACRRCAPNGLFP